MNKNDAKYAPNSTRTGIFNNIENLTYSIEFFCRMIDSLKVYL